MMKYAEEIIKEIKNRETINTDDYLIDKDDAWENYIRGKRDILKEKRKRVYYKGRKRGIRKGEE